MHNSRAYVKGQGKRIEQLHVNHFHDELSFDESMKEIIFLLKFTPQIMNILMFVWLENVISYLSLARR